MTVAVTEKTPAALPSPARLMQLALAYRSSAVLFAAADLEIFTQLGDGTRSAADLSASSGFAAEPLRMLLDACVADGLLVSDGAGYRNSPVADAYLVKGRPAYIASGMKFAEDLYPAWGRLAELVRTGRPVVAPESFLGDDKAKTRAFVYAMHERAKGISSVLPHGADFSGRKRLLDVGGGPGTYSISLVRQTPGLHATVLDLPGVLEVSREIIAEHGCGDRIDVRPANYLTDAFGSGYDAALLSGMMHRETPEGCRMILRKTFDALEPGAMVVVSDVFFNDHQKNTPPFTTFFAINMMLMSDEGSAHAKTEMAEWMTQAGFRNIEIRDMPPPNPHSLVIGEKP
jgi:2-polyprenyl-3-methyl-5-hydroxy-6-metoxy-1,4-benzoquinol methylase